MFAIIETGGKQIKVEEGQEIYVEKLNANEGDSFTYDKVTVFTYKRRKDSKRKKGHRQPYTKLTIDKINA